MLTVNAPTLSDVARADVSNALSMLGARASGLSQAEAGARLASGGPNALHTHESGLLAVIGRQFRNPMLILLAAAALASIGFGEHTDAAIILAIVVLSVALGFINEFRAARAVEDLHARVRRFAMARRDGSIQRTDVTALVPGDVVLLDTGDIVPADARILESSGLECDESVLTGEAIPAEKHASPADPASTGLELPSIVFMGTVVRAGKASAVVVKTGASTVIGGIALHLARRLPETAFQVGLRRFAQLLVIIATVLSLLVFVVNLMFGRPLFESLLFAVSISVVLTPQLLPAIVTISMATGARRMAKKSVIVKRLVVIEDFGNIDTLFTDKTGTLTQGQIAYAGAFDALGRPSDEILRLGLLCNAAVVQDGTVVGGNALDAALWSSDAARRTDLSEFRRIAEAPFDYERRRMSVLIEGPGGARTIVTKGAPESVLACCAGLPAALRPLLDAQFASGARVVAVAQRPAGGAADLAPSDERDLEAIGLLTFVDPPKPGAKASLDRLRELGIDVKIATGDNERVAQKVCADLGVPVASSVTGAQLDAMSDADLVAALPTTTIFARVSPEQKSRLIRAAHALGADVGFLGDGVNDAVALHDADVGISVDTAADVARDAADVVLLDKDLGILADGVVEGRRIFANTVKYVLMATSSNFGNTISTAVASLVLPFLPLLPSQILLNNLLYDVSEMTIPTDNVDPELLERPARWDMHFIQRFMMVFGVINSLFDFAIFGVMLLIFHAGIALFRSGFFLENFMTQTLVIFAIRTRRVPFFRSRPGAALTATTLLAAAAGGLLPFLPVGAVFGFTPLPRAFFIALMAIILTAYFTLVEVAKIAFFRRAIAPAAKKGSVDRVRRRLHDLVLRFVSRTRGAPPP